VLPPSAGPAATLEAARQLLHNPPSPHDSPSAVEQWHHDIDQLVVAANNTPPHGGRQVNCLGGALVPSVVHSRSPVAHSRSPAAPRASSAVRAASLATVDLRAELEHRRSGEDVHITIKHQRERHCNLDGDFGVVDTTPMRQAAHTPASPAGSGGGCMVLAPYLRSGLVVQVPAPLARKIRWECQPRRVPVDLLHFNPCCRRE
jgi:hypothetical protein